MPPSCASTRSRHQKARMSSSAPSPLCHADWQQHTSVLILTVPGHAVYGPRGKACAQRARAAGFPFVDFFEGRVVPGPTARVSAHIINEHRRALSAALPLARSRGHAYALVLEDDCLFNAADVVRSRVAAALSAADAPRFEGWPILHLGPVSLTPYLPQTTLPLVQIPTMWTAHAILFRVQHAQSLLDVRPWARGRVVEGWAALPLRHRLGVFPIVAYQDSMPREVFLRDADYRSLTAAWDVFMHTGAAVLLLALCVGAVALAKRLGTSTTRANKPFFPATP